MNTGPTKTVDPIAGGERVRVIDALRGFALFGILAVNMAAFRAPVFGDAGVAAGDLDRAVTFVIALGFEQKFYVLFSFLFGYGLSVQMFRAAARGTPFVPRFLRRLLGLLLIGLAHALLLFTGDILVTYALLGFVLLLMRNARDGVLLGVAAGLVVFTALTFVLGRVVFLAQHDGGASTVAPPDDGGQALGAYRGSAAEVISQRAREYPGALGFALLGQGPTALATFLLGLWAGRRRLFERVDENLPLLRRARAAGLIVGGTGALVWATERSVSGLGLDAGFFLASAVDFATAPFLTATYVVTIALLFRIPAWRRLLSPLVPVGRMALSNYLLQSLVASLIFTGYGLGLYGRVGPALGLALSLSIFAAQIPLSALWMRRFDFGPAEWALRSFTYARLQRLRSRAGGNGGTPASGPPPPDLVRRAGRR